MKLLSVIAGMALGAGICAAVAAPMASAETDPCTAAGLATTISGVTAPAGQYLNANPDANEAITGASTETPEVAKANLRAYFISHPQQYNDLRAIAQPLTDLRTTCNRDVSASQIAALLQAFETS